MGISERDYMKKESKKVTKKVQAKSVETNVVEPQKVGLCNRDIYNLMIEGTAIVLVEKVLDWDIRENKPKTSGAIGSIVLYDGVEYVIVWDREGNINNPIAAAEIKVPGIDGQGTPPNIQYMTHGEKVAPNESWTGDEKVDDFNPTDTAPPKMDLPKKK